MQVKVIYFASLRDATGTTEEVVETRAKNLDELFSTLNKKYSFSLKQQHLRAAINEVYRPFDAKLNENDVVVFIPPVAGG